LQSEIIVRADDAAAVNRNLGIPMQLDLRQKSVGISVDGRRL
jgi:hypothetical protein